MWQMLPEWQPRVNSAIASEREPWSLSPLSMRLNDKIKTPDVVVQVGENNLLNIKHYNQIFNPTNSLNVKKCMQNCKISSQVSRVYLSQ